MQRDEFRRLIRQMGDELFRPMPWRDDTRPYYVLVSELMLQQTQVARVIPKFTQFIARFPDEASLARAELSEVLTMWQGLGYNRRAKFLHDAAKRIVAEHHGTFPAERSDIVALPGVGANTCGAIEAYAFGRPAIFIETNVRTVYIHHFFNDDFEVTDAQLRQVLEGTIDASDPRSFYWALMDYGSWLKANGVRNISQSRHYKKQSALEGSVRQVRGMIVRSLTTQGMNMADLKRTTSADERFEPALNGLMRDGLVSLTAGRYHLTK